MTMNNVIKSTKNFTFYVNFRAQVMCYIKTVVPQSKFHSMSIGYIS